MTGTERTLHDTDTSAWVRGSLPRFNQLVVAYLKGFKQHSDKKWVRDGWAFMVRHDSLEHTVADKWASHQYNEALKRLDADHLDVIQWLSLERPYE